MNLFALICCRHSHFEMYIFCLLTSMELILRPNCSLLHLRFNNMKSFFLTDKNVVDIKANKNTNEVGVGG